MLSSSVKKVSALPSLPALPVLPGRKIPMTDDNNDKRELPTYSVNITNSCGWEVIIENQIHPFKVNTPAHYICTDQDPNLRGGGGGGGNE